MFKTLVPFLSIIISVMIFVFFTKPMYAEIQSIRSESANYEKVANSFVDFNRKVQALLDKKNQISLSDREKLDKLVPSEIDIPRTLVDIEMLAKSTGILFGNVSVSTASEQTTKKKEVAVQEKELVSQKITFDVIGTYDQFKQFLQLLESNLHIIEVVDMRLTASNGLFQQYNVSVQTYALQKK